MALWILLVLGLFVLQTFLAPATRYALRGDVAGALGPRDNPPELSLTGQRLQRALRNLFEALPVFLTIALLCVHYGAESGHAILGAQIFFFARLLYVLVYAMGVPVVRSLLWVVGHAGLITMLVGLWPHLGL